MMKKETVRKKEITEWQINTNDGFVDFRGIIETNELDVIRLEFFDIKPLRCAHNHILFDKNGIEIYSQNVKKGDILIGKNNQQIKVKNIIFENKKERMYDAFNVQNPTKSYLTNNILSHNCFIGSSKTLIDPKVLESLESEDSINQKLNIKFWEEPKVNHSYVIGADVAKGTGGDYSVAQVIDITYHPFKQVAIYRNNFISPRKFGNVLYDLGEKYNDAVIMLENNDIGHATVDYLWHDLEYENLLNYDNKKGELGIRSTKKTKSLATDILKEYVESKTDENKIIIQDLDTIYELSKFTEVRPGIFKSEEGENDDCVTALMWALFFVLTSWYDEDDIKNSKDNKNNKNNKNNKKETNKDEEEPHEFILADDDIFDSTKGGYDEEIFKNSDDFGY